MKTKFNGILTLLLALVAQVAFAQQTVTGTVIDPEGEPIFGATVQVKGGTTFATTDFDGKYSIEASGEDTLVFSYTGYAPKEMVVGTQTTIDITLSASLEEIVVIGYRSTIKKKSNVAASVVSAETIENRPNASFVQRLQGQVAGLTVQTASGQPGANSLIQIRGVSSINGNTEPLIILDGIPIDEDAFRTINPNDIASTTVLKDAAGTAIYGNRGANGVIVITTKSGKYGQDLTVTYNSQYQLTELIDTDYRLYDSRGYLALEKRENSSQGLGPSLSDAEIAAFPINTDWTDTFFRTGRSQVHNLTIANGGENFRQSTSIGFSDQEGSLLASDLKRFTLRNKFNVRSKDEKFNLTTSVLLGYSRQNFQTEPDNARNGFIYFNTIFNANRGLPYFDPNNLETRTEEWFNSLQARLSPFVTLDNVNRNLNYDDELKSVVSADMSYEIAKGLTARYQLGFDYTQVRGLRVADPTGVLPRVRASFIGPTAVEGFQTEDYSHDFRFNSLLNLGYTTTFGEDNKHSITGNVYLEYVKAHFKSFFYTQTGLNPRTFSPGNGAGFIADNGDDDNFVPAVGAGKAETGLFSYFADVDYDFDSTFGFRATIRRDASSRFTDDNQWGTFYSVSGRVNLEELLFEEGTKDVLKARVSYGTTGNDRIAGTYYGALNNFRTLFTTGNAYADNQTIFRTQLGNPDLKWETIRTTNVGFDFEFFENRLRGSLDVYQRDTEDLFFNRFVSTLVTPSGSVAANLGDIRNRGVELGVNYDLVRSQEEGGFNFGVYANVNYNENEVIFIDVPNGIQDNGFTVIQEGVQLNEFFVVPYVGVNPANGNLLFLNADNQLTEAPTEDDRRLTGTDTTPDFQGGFGFTSSWKNFFIETQFNFATGLSRIDSNLAAYNDFQNNIGEFQLSSDLDRAWTPSNRITDVPALNATNAAPGVTTDRFLLDSDWVRLRFLQLGYAFPQDVLNETFLSQARVFVSGENLLTWTEWAGSDPESQRATEFNRYPNAKTFSVGLDLTF